MLKIAVLLFLCSVVACGIPGGWNRIEVDRDDVLKVANHAAKELGKKFNTPYHVKTAKIVKAESQVVAGYNYRLTVIVGLTDCKKAEVDYNDIETCNFQDNVSTYRKCDVRVYEDLHNHLSLTYSGCILAGRDEVHS